MMTPIDEGELTFEVVGPGNASVLERVEDDVFDNPIRPDILPRYLEDSNNLLVVACYAGVVVGMASGIFYLHPDKPLQLFVNEVGVSERYQRSGIGGRLMQVLLDCARARGATEAWVGTEVENLPARGLYAKAGGAEQAERAAIFVWKLEGR